MASKRSRAPQPRALKRKVATRPPRKTLVIFCEGEKTEPQYLLALKQEAFVRDAAAVDIRVETGRGGTVPLTLVTLATAARANPCFELWLILHHRNHGSWLDNSAAVELRRQLDGSTNKSLDAAKYMSLIEDAVQRAAALDTRHQRDGSEFPTTTRLRGCIT